MLQLYQRQQQKHLTDQLDRVHEQRLQREQAHAEAEMAASDAAEQLMQQCQEGEKVRGSFTSITLYLVTLHISCSSQFDQCWVGIGRSKQGDC